MNEQERGREYLADVLGISPAELEESLRGIVFPAYRRAGVELFEQLARLERGPRPDLVLRDDVVSDHGTGPAVDVGPDGWQWWKSLRAQQPAVQPLPVHLLPGRDQIRYAETVVEAMRARFGPWRPAEPPMLEHGSPVRQARLTALAAPEPWAAPYRAVQDVQAALRAARARQARSG